METKRLLLELWTEIKDIEKNMPEYDRRGVKKIYAQRRNNLQEFAQKLTEAIEKDQKRIEKACACMCDDYCRFPREWDEEAEGLTVEDGACAYCPLNFLQSGGKTDEAAAEI